MPIFMEDAKTLGIILCERHFGEVHHFSFARTVSVESAADLTAETLAAAFLARAWYENRGLPAGA